MSMIKPSFRLGMKNLAVSFQKSSFATKKAKLEARKVVVIGGGNMAEAIIGAIKHR